MERCNDKDLFIEPHPLEGTVLDIDTPCSQKAITSLPDNFQIRTKSDIKILQEYVAFNYTKGISLYRGHESRDYKIESTIVRHVKGKKKECSVEDILEAEKNEYNLFRRDVFKTEWLHNKPQKTDEMLFAMSIGRHLGLPCRLIDVTASLETAIWFAVMNPKFHNVDGEIILIYLCKNDVLETNQSPFNATKLSYAHEPFMTDSLSDLPLGEQRRFVQNGHFIWVDNNSLLNEEQVIRDSVVLVRHFTIPWQAKNTLANELRREVYNGFIHHRFNC